MYQAGNQVVYGIHGVCRVVDLETQMVDGKKRTYLVLEPLNQERARYLVPADNPMAMAKLRTVLTKDAWNQLLESNAVREDGWIQDENLRKQTYRELISGGDRERLLRMVHTLYVHKAAQSAAGKKVHLCDDNFLRDAEKCLAGEIAIAMNMEPDEAKNYLKTILK